MTTMTHFEGMTVHSESLRDPAITKLQASIYLSFVPTSRLRENAHLVRKSYLVVT